MFRRGLISRWFVVASLLALLIGAMGAGGPAAAAPLPDQVPGELLIRFAGDATDADVLAAMKGVRALEQGLIAAIGVRQFKLPAGADAEAAVRWLKALPNVRYAEPNYIAHAMLTPNDPGWGQQWGPKKIQADRGWDLYPGTFTAPPAGATIAIIDTGVDLTHPDLRGRLVAGTTFVTGTTTAQDDNGHGTHVAGIAAATANNAVGIAGIAYNARLMPIKVLNGAGSGTYANIVSGITYAADHGAKVINMSLGGTTNSQAMQDAVNYAYSKGALIVAAAGNSATSVPQYPAAMKNVMAVVPTDPADATPSSANYGSWVSVAAPGTNIYSTYLGGGYASLSGSSMAVPHVAGLAALLFAQNATRTNTTVRSLIQTTADKVGSFPYVNGRNDHYGYGRINVYRALGGTP